MRTRHIFAALVSAALLRSCSSETPPNVRTEVSRPLNEAVLLSYQFPDNPTITAKLNQAASVPNLNKDEQDKIRNVKVFLVHKLQNRAGGPAANDVSTLTGQWPDVH